MLRELNFVESDWGALRWALGSTTALFRHSVPRQLRARFEPLFGPLGRVTLKHIGMRTVGMVSGVAIAGGVLTLFVQSCLRLVATVFSTWQLGHAPLLAFLIVTVIPETAFIVIAVALWRRQRSMATGILLAAMIFAAHVIVHVATHG